MKVSGNSTWFVLRLRLPDLRPLLRLEVFDHSIKLILVSLVIVLVIAIASLPTAFVLRTGARKMCLRTTNVAHLWLGAIG